MSRSVEDTMVLISALYRCIAACKTPKNSLENKISLLQRRKKIRLSARLSDVGDEFPSRIKFISLSFAQSANLIGDENEDEKFDEGQPGRCQSLVISRAEGGRLAGGVRGAQCQQDLVGGVRRGGFGAHRSAGYRPKLPGVGLRRRVNLPGLPEPSAQPQAEPRDLAVALERISGHLQST